MKLGDIAYYAFRPMVYLIDAIWGTDLKDCERCRERRAKWNSLPGSGAWATLIFAVTIWGAIILWGP